MIYIPALWIQEKAKINLTMSIGFTVLILMTSLCFIASLIRNTTLRKVLSFTSGLTLGFYSFGFGYIIVVICFLTAYVPIMLLPRYYGSIACFLIAATQLVFFNYQDWKHGIQMHHQTWIIQIMMNFIKIHMTSTSYRNAGVLERD